MLALLTQHADGKLMRSSEIFDYALCYDPNVIFSDNFIFVGGFQNSISLVTCCVQKHHTRL